MQEIENQVRLLLSDVFNLEDIQKTCIERERQVNTLDDLTFGEYIHIIEQTDKWERLGLNLDKSLFIKMLNDVRLIRNDIMHFEPDGISPSQHKQLASAVRLLSSLLTGKAH